MPAGILAAIALKSCGHRPESRGTQHARTSAVPRSHARLRPASPSAEPARDQSQGPVGGAGWRAGRSERGLLIQAKVRQPCIFVVVAVVGWWRGRRMV